MNDYTPEHSAKGLPTSRNKRERSAIALVGIKNKLEDSAIALPCKKYKLEHSAIGLPRCFYKPEHSAKPLAGNEYRPQRSAVAPSGIRPGKYFRGFRPKTSISASKTTNHQSPIDSPPHSTFRIPHSAFNRQAVGIGSRWNCKEPPRVRSVIPATTVFFRS
ncbi:MAG: hypothetical protein HZC54_17615 [Verrucomicrobia bacterium]|nr:hypothetical protein [Verrucomicrobiota bacterium]